MARVQSESIIVQRAGERAKFTMWFYYNRAGQMVVIKREKKIIDRSTVQE